MGIWWEYLKLKIGACLLKGISNWDKVWEIKTYSALNLLRERDENRTEWWLPLKGCRNLDSVAPSFRVLFRTLKAIEQGGGKKTWGCMDLPAMSHTWSHLFLQETLVYRKRNHWPTSKSFSFPLHPAVSQCSFWLPPILLEKKTLERSRIWNRNIPSLVQMKLVVTL